MYMLFQTDYQLEKLLNSRIAEDVIHEQLEVLMGTPEGKLIGPFSRYIYCFIWQHMDLLVSGLNSDCFG